MKIDKQAIQKTVRKGKDFSYRNIMIWLAFGFSLIALSLSFSAQYIWNIEPCGLCKLERLPYFILLVLSGVYFLTRLRILSYRLIQTAFLISLGLSCFHLLVLAGIIRDPCSVPTNIDTLEDFRNMLNAPLPCSKAGWKLGGIPMTGYNVLTSAMFLGLLSLKISKTN